LSFPSCTPGPHCSGSTPSRTRTARSFLTSAASRSPFSHGDVGASPVSPNCRSASAKNASDDASLSVP
jgi:hypothetical protein